MGWGLQPSESLENRKARSARFLVLKGSKYSWVLHLKA